MLTRPTIVRLKIWVAGGSPQAHATACVSRAPNSRVANTLRQAEIQPRRHRAKNTWKCSLDQLRSKLSINMTNLDLDMRFYWQQNFNFTCCFRITAAFAVFQTFLKLLKQIIGLNFFLFFIRNHCKLSIFENCLWF